MAAAASAAGAADTLLADPSVAHRSLATVAVLVAGMTEAAGLGIAESVLLQTTVAGLRSTRFVVTTVVVAGAFWAVASVPGLTGGPSGDSGHQPSGLLVVLAGAALGAVAGAVLGRVQTLTFRAQVRRPWVWTTANVVGWALAMPIIMLGAITPSAEWPTAIVIPWAGLTGLVAGAALGAVLGWFAPSLQDVAPHNRLVLALLLRGRPRRLADAVLGLRVTGRRTGRPIRLPVVYAEADRGLWVAVGRPHRKTWWRNLAAPAHVEVLRHGCWHSASAELVPPSDDRYPDGLAAYRRRWPRARVGGADPLVRITEEAPP
jgi:deazaflavin-dependent oxidoreductase (nitroreductase family)